MAFDLAAGIWSNFLLLLPMAFIFAVGNILRARNFLKESDVASMSKILYWIVCPALLFRSSVMAGAHLSRSSASLAAAFLLCALLASLCAVLLARLRKQDLDLETLAVSAAAAQKPNAVFLGLPVVMLIFGEENMIYASIYVAIAMPIHNVLAPVMGELTAARGGSPGELARRSLAGLLKNPIVLSSLCGLLAYFLGLRELPQAVDRSLHLIGVCSTGLSLLALGASIEAKKIFGSISACWNDILIRLFLHPLLLLLWFRFFPAEPMMVRVAVVMTAMPTAITMYILADGMDIDAEYAAGLVVATTMLSLLTISLWSVLLGV